MSNSTKQRNTKESQEWDKTKIAVENYVQATRFIVELLPEIVKDFQTN